MASTAFFRHSIPYEVFYAVHFLFLVMYSLAIAHTLDVAQRSGKKDRSQTFKWFAAPLVFYLCDYAMMYLNQRFNTKVISFTAVEGHEGSRMVILKLRKPTLFIFQSGQ
jgi:predicted ferric reductase